MKNQVLSIANKIASNSYKKRKKTDIKTLAYNVYDKLHKDGYTVELQNLTNFEYIIKILNTNLSILIKES